MHARALTLYWLALQAQTPAPPKDAAGWHAMGARYAQAGDYELAEPALAEACRMEPRRRDACYMLGRVRYLSNRFDGAVAPLRQSLANGESEARATLALAQTHEGLDDAHQAEALFAKAVKLAAPDAELRYGMFLLRQGRVDEAAVQARRHGSTVPLRARSATNERPRGAAPSGAAASRPTATPPRPTSRRH